MRAQKADSIAGIVRRIRGAENVNIEQEGPQNNWHIKLTMRLQPALALMWPTYKNMIEAAIGGKAVSVLYDETKRYNIVVRFYRNFATPLMPSIICRFSRRADHWFPWSQLAEIKFTEGQTNITTTASACLRAHQHQGRDRGGFVNELPEKITASIKLPKGYSLIYGGQYENLKRVGHQLVFTIPLAIILVFCVLFMLYKKP